MPGLPLSNLELQTVLRQGLSRTAKRDPFSNDTTEDADYDIINRLVSLNPVGPRKDIVEKSLIRDTSHRNGAFADNKDEQ